VRDALSAGHPLNPGALEGKDAFSLVVTEASVRGPFSCSAAITRISRPWLFHHQL